MSTELDNALSGVLHTLLSPWGTRDGREGECDCPICTGSRSYDAAVDWMHTYVTCPEDSEEQLIDVGRFYHRTTLL